MGNEQDWKFDKDKASKALQKLSCHINPFRDECVAELVRVKYFTCLGLYNSLEAMKKLNMKFEENRFFPVQRANPES